MTQPDPAQSALAAIRLWEVTQKELASVTLINGVVLKIKPVAKRALAAITDVFHEPEVPLFTNPTTGREEPNPLDPDYLLALDGYERAVMEAAFKVMLSLGTSVDSVPDGIERPESDGWIDMLKTVGLEPRTEGHGRYLDWLEYIALTESSDLAVVQAAVAIRTGVTEGRVAEAIQYFRNNKGRGADLASPPPGGGADGDRLPETPAPVRPRVRRTRSGSI